MIQLNKADFEKMLAHATRELPDEACGLIAGEVPVSYTHLDVYKRQAL